jgi:STE24 endopeptidase
MRFFVILALLFIVSPAFAFDPQAATDAYLKTVSAAAKLKSDSYFEGGYWLILWNALYGIGVSVLLIVGGFSARMRSLGQKLARWRWPSIALYGVFWALAMFVLSLPLDFYQNYIREHQYALSNQNFFAWLSDDLIGLAVSVVATAIILPVIYAVIRVAPKSWWIWGTGVVLGFLAVAVVISPLFLEPLFNHFQSLAPGPIREQILSLARSDGVPAHDVLEFDNSRQTKRISAHVSGLFGTTQISLNDNLLKQCTPDEVLAVLGHEMGHYVMGHVFTFLCWEFFVIAAGFAFSRWVLGRAVRLFGIEGPADVAGFPVIYATFTLYFLVLTPLTNTLTRTQEMQADIFGLNLARRPDAFATVALKLSNYRKLEPGPWEEFVFYDHPSGRTRIFTAMRWKAENLAGGK